MCMKNDYRKPVSLFLCRMLLMLFCTVALVHSQGAVIKEVSLEAGPRGLVLVVQGSAAIDGSVLDIDRKEGKYSDLCIDVKNAAWTLNGKKYGCPDNLPVKEIVAKENGNKTQILLKMRGQTDGPVQMKIKNDKILVMLTAQAQPQVSWSASTSTPVQEETAAVSDGGKTEEIKKTVAQTSTTVVSEKNQNDKPVVNVTIPSQEEKKLQNIRIVQRDKTAALIFEFSVSPDVQFVAAADSLVAIFPNASSSLKSKMINIPGGTVYRSIKLKQSNASGGKQLTAVVKLMQKSVGSQPVGNILENKYSVYTIAQDTARAFLWNAADGVQSSYSFAHIQSEPLDMKKMEKRAVEDTARNLKKSNLFPLAEEKTPEVASQSVPAASVEHASIKESATVETSAAPVTQNSSVQAKAVQASIPPSAPPKEPTKAVVPEVVTKRDSTIAIELPSKTSDVKVEQETVSEPTGEVVKESPEGNLVTYKIFGRDPFIPLIKDTSASEMPRVENLKLVGVLEDARERIALLEDFTAQNRAYALRVDDQVESGKVLRIYRDKVVFLVRDFDVSRSFTLNLASSPNAK